MGERVVEEKMMDDLEVKICAGESALNSFGLLVRNTTSTSRESILRNRHRSCIEDRVFLLPSIPSLLRLSVTTISRLDTTGNRMAPR